MKDEECINTGTQSIRADEGACLNHARDLVAARTALVKTAGPFEPQRATGSRVRVASLVDLFGMKMRVIQVRGNWKDYVDIHALTSHGIDLPTALAAAKGIDTSFNPATSIRALQFYGDGTLDRVPLAMQRDLTRWAQEVDLGKLPALRPRRGLSPGGMEL
jgi:hypothetical protein